MLEVTPYDLLYGVEHAGNRSHTNDIYVISKGTDKVYWRSRISS